MYGWFTLFPGPEQALSVALSTSILLWTLPMSRTFLSCQAQTTRESIPFPPLVAAVTQLFVSINLTTLRRWNHSDCSFGSGFFLLEWCFADSSVLFAIPAPKSILCQQALLSGPPSTGIIGMCCHTQQLTWVLWIWTPILMLAQQTLHWMNHHSSPK